MTLSEVEQWALRELRRAVPKESDRVEFKSQISDPVKLARQIAGHGNAARGEWILWIFGIDENRGLVGIPDREWANLWPQIESYFDGRPPRPVIVQFEENDKAITAVAFETSLPPYVVKNPAHDRLEVPLREETRTRSAKHSELLLILGPTSSIPEVEIVKTHWHSDVLHAPHVHTKYTFDANLYFMPKSRSRVAIPFHRIKPSVSINDIDFSDQIDIDWYKERSPVLTPLQFGLPGNEGAETQATCDDYQLILDRPAMIRLNTSLIVPHCHSMATLPIKSVTLSLRCSVNFEPLPLVISLRFQY